MSRFGRRSDLRGPRTAQRKSRGFAFTVSDLEQRTMMSVTTGLVSDINQLDSNPTNLTDIGRQAFLRHPGQLARHGVALGDRWNGAGGRPARKHRRIRQQPPLEFHAVRLAGRYGLLHGHGPERQSGPVQDRRNGRRHSFGLPDDLPRKHPGGRRRKGLFHRERPIRPASSGPQTARQTGRPSRAWFDQPVASPIVVTPAVHGNSVYFTTPRLSTAL